MGHRIELGSEWNLSRTSPSLGGNQSPPHREMAEPAERASIGGVGTLDVLHMVVKRDGVHDRVTKLTRSRAPCPHWRLYLGIFERPWSFTMALELEQSLLGGLGTAIWLVCRPSRVVIFVQTRPIIGDASWYARRSNCCGTSKRRIVT